MLCCKAHCLTVCGECCVDYSFMQEILDESKDPDSDNELPNLDSVDEEEIRHEGSSNSSTCNSPSILAAHRLISRPWQNQNPPNPIALIARFIPPKDTDTPQTLFEEGHRFIPPKDGDTPDILKGVGLFNGGPRFIRRANGEQMLLYTDGACSNNGQFSATAGCAFVYRPSSFAPPNDGTVSFPLEIQGPSGVTYPPTSNRAELRAVIAALQFRSWTSEGWTELVIATDSEYVVLGATQWVRGWLQNGWLTNKKTPVKNRDLWELLLQRIQELFLQRMQDVRFRVLFWRIPREWNQLADQGAKAAVKEDAPTKFTPIHGVLV